MAIFGAGIMFGPIIGPLLGGWITDNWSWHWIFFINIPVGAISILMSLAFIIDPPYMKGVKMKIDYWGLFFLAVGIGALQMVLDRGQREDWFSSEFITWLTVISAVFLILFIIVEIFAEHPIVNLRAFKNFSFSLGNVVLFFVLVNLFGSIVLLPIYLQTLMGYTATLAGVLLGPGGVATLISMPIAGKLVSRVNPKGLIAFGIILTGYATLLMSRFSLAADFSSILWPRVLMGVSMAFIFVPLMTLTLSSIRKEEMANATSIFNLIRNLGGSFGVAFVTTMLTRRAQFHQARLVEHLTPYDTGYNWSIHQGAQALQNAGIDPSGQGGLGIIYEKNFCGSP